MSKQYDLGKEGEEIAAFYLAQKGYKILHRNWRHRKLELDIVLSKDNFLIIVEVKTRSSQYFEKPQDAVTIKKQKFLFDATEAYLESYKLDLEVRFDIVSIVLNDKTNQIEHIEAAFRPGW